MTRFLLDRDVMSQLDQPDVNRHDNIKAWLASVPDNALFVSAITVVEAWKGLTAARKRAGDDPEKLRDNDRFQTAFERLLETLADRIVPIDALIAKHWGGLLGLRDKNRFDACVAATATARGMVVATRNTVDFERLGARVLDPFSRRPAIREPERL